MNDEKFKQVPGFENYLVSNYGRVYNVETGYYLKPIKDSNGRLKVVLTKNRIRHCSYINRLVFSVFVGEIPDGWVVYTIDENPLNMHLDNLDIMEKNRFMSKINQETSMFNADHTERNKNIRYEYNILNKSINEISKKYNTSEYIVRKVILNITGYDPNYIRLRMPHTPMSRNTKLKKEILEKYKYKTQREIAEEYGISRSQVSQLIRTETKRYPMSKNTNLKKEILEKYKYKTQTEIAEEYGISQSQVSQIIRSEIKRFPMSRNANLKKEILEKYKYKSQLEIAEEYGISQSWISRIIRSQTIGGVNEKEINYE
ncbi:MAG: NUMOD4 domain-containing protein [archaeon]